MKMPRRKMLGMSAAAITGLGAAGLGQVLGVPEASAAPARPKTSGKNGSGSGVFFIPNRAITPIIRHPPRTSLDPLSMFFTLGTGEKSQTLTPPQVDDVFMVFQLAKDKEGKTRLLHYDEVDPVVDAPDSAPDVLLKVNMECFHIAGSIPLHTNSGVTIRLSLGKSEDSRRTEFDNLFWTANSALKFYDDLRQNKFQPKDAQVSLSDAWGKAPVQIPGGLGQILFTVAKHRQPQWWQQLFTTAKQVMAVVGFPALGTRAIEVLDALNNQSDDSVALFSSHLQTFAFSKQAAQAYSTDGGRIGCLNPGLWVMAPGRDADAFRSESVIYHASKGRLVIAGHEEDTQDPFADHTYLVLRSQAAATKLDPQFGFTKPTIGVSVEK